MWRITTSSSWSLIAFGRRFCACSCQAGAWWLLWGCVSPRRKFGRHVVVPLHASIQEHCRRLGFDNLAPIIWHKITNMSLESSRGSSFLGKPYEPNAVIKNDIEYILFQRKPGGYRSPSQAVKLLSLIPEAEHRAWFQQIWSLGGASTREHPAPFPVALAERLVRMFSFVGYGPRPVREDRLDEPGCGYVGAQQHRCEIVDRYLQALSRGGFSNEVVDVCQGTGESG